MIGNQRFVILSDPHVVKDILVTNGAIFSSRKEMFLKVQTILVHRGITASSYNETWYVCPISSPERPLMLLSPLPQAQA